MNYRILHEDKDVIAAEKPEGLASISENDPSIETLHSMLSKIYSYKIFVVHRIDKDVSGIILFAKNSKTHKFLNEQFNSRKVKKTYLAVVLDNIRDDEGVIESPIREFGSGRMGIDENKGKPSITKFKVLERFTGHTLIEVDLVTGRRHQIRVHLYSIGHPIAGDIRYGDKVLQSKYPRMMLHSHRIVFQLPSGKEKAVVSELPQSFQTFFDNFKIKS